MDNLAYTNMNYLAVWAAGNGRSNPNQSGQNHQHFDELGLKHDHHYANDTNYGGFGTLNYLATAKNGVTVGAVGDLINGWQNATGVVMTSFSFWGPTDDGRIKPDIVSNGTTIYSTTMTTNGTLTYTTGSGTSGAAATVTGSLGLLTERFNQFGRKPTSATLRGLLIHTADDAGLEGPDYKFGFGLMNTDHAARLIMENTATYNPLSSGLLPDGHLLEGVLTNGTTQEFTVVQPINSPLRATLTWTDPPGFYSGIQGQLNPTNRMLVNDLDMVVVNALVATNYPFTLDPVSPYAPAHSNTNNRLDNVEQVFVPTNTTGSIVYLTIRITHQGTLVDSGYLGSTTNQPYSLWVEGNLVYPKPLINGITQTGSNTVAVAWYATVGTDYKVQYIDEVDAPASAWTDATGTVTAQYPLTAVEVAYSPSQPKRFYRIALP